MQPLLWAVLSVKQAQSAMLALTLKNRAYRPILGALCVQKGIKTAGIAFQAALRYFCSIGKYDSRTIAEADNASVWHIFREIVFRPCDIVLCPCRFAMSTQAVDKNNTKIDRFVS